ncbi:hypothetical protein PSACC_02985 [Paramicrosporidium saccamoebae]|uniref:Uncharacterized protein n=1 Tax=Paramicrosporidium saccamoebae TaxID=1246581 RepID=A0A2H9THK0_9FUNG|nr:hypothetical protein PSACC_02985 [Paramicrosporidium saccamoebae]
MSGKIYIEQSVIRVEQKVIVRKASNIAVGRQKVSFWTLKTLASGDFDPKRLTERQQIAYFAAQSQAAGNPLMASPFRIDRLLASSISETPLKAKDSPQSAVDNIHLDESVLDTIVDHEAPEEADGSFTIDKDEAIRDLFLSEFSYCEREKSTMTLNLEQYVHALQDIQATKAIIAASDRVLRKDKMANLL